MSGVHFSFETLLEVLGPSSEDIFDGLYAVICEEPHNPRHVFELSNSAHGQVSLQNKCIFVQWPLAVMNLRPYGHRLD